MGKQNKCERRTGKKINKIAETEEEHSGLVKPQNAARAEHSVSKNSDSSIDLESDINLEREFDAVRKRGQQCVRS